MNGRSTNDESLSQLVHAMGGWLRRQISDLLPRNLRGRVDPSDVLQNVWLSVCRKLPSMTRRGDRAAIRHIVLTIAKRKAMRAVRGQRVARRDVAKECATVNSSIADGRPTPVNEAIGKETLELLKAKLSAQDLQILELHMNGATPQDIATHMKQNVGTTYRHINRIIRTAVLSSGRDDERAH